MSANLGAEVANFKCDDCEADTDSVFWDVQKDGNVTYYSETKDTCRCSNFYTYELNPFLNALLPQEKRMSLPTDPVPWNIVPGQWPYEEMLSKGTRNSRRRKQKAKARVARMLTEKKEEI
jgi:hypothetical protein